VIFLNEQSLVEGIMRFGGPGGHPVPGKFSKKKRAVAIALHLSPFIAAFVFWLLSK